MSDITLSSLLSGNFEGAQGVQGTQGIQGPQGTQGIIGPQGTFFSRVDYTFNVIGITTSFNAAYTVSAVDVYLNGSRLSEQDYTANNGTTIELNIPANDGDILDVITFESSGPQGTQGIQGTQGTQGLDGAFVAQGIQGTQGTDGAFVAQGIQGTQGLDGAFAGQGIQGTQGIQGIDGTLGSALMVAYAAAL